MKRILCSLLILCITSLAMAQNVGIGTTTPKPSAQLDVTSTSRGMLIPRMTSAQRKAIASPEFGLMVFDTDKGTVMFFDGQNWRAMAFTDENASSATVRSADDPQENAYYGTRVAISGDYAIVSAIRYGTPTRDYSGAAYILYKSATGWMQQAKLVPSDSATRSYFGGSVAISGDYAVVGATGKTVGTSTNAGKVYVYKRNGTTWVKDTEFTKPGAATGETFGYSVGVSSAATGGPLVAVGIPASVYNGTAKGEVYTYQRNASNTWNLVVAMHPSDLVNNDRFGSCISMDGNTMAIGAPLQDNTTYSLADAGAAYIFLYNGTAFTLQQKLTGITANAQFGVSMALDGNRIAIGAPYNTLYSNTTALVSLYTRTGTTWAGPSSLYLNDSETPGFPTVTAKAIEFGLGLALQGNDLFIGAPGAIDSPTGTSSFANTSGTVFVYKFFANNTVGKVNIIRPPNPSYSDIFGCSIGLSNGRYIIANPKATSAAGQQIGGVLLGDVN